METIELLKEAKTAVRAIGSLSEDKINATLKHVADTLVENADDIIKANILDLGKFSPEDYRYDRLKLDIDRIKAIASDMRNVAKLPSPRRILEERVLPNGLELKKVSVPFGVVGVIYEARPNVSADVFSLCFKSGNVCVLKGGHDAEESNKAIVRVIQGALRDCDVTQEAVTLLPSTRDATHELLTARGLVDLIIPRGSKNLIDNVRMNATVPVIETGAGVCHCYIHSSADLSKATAIINNAKTRRVSVCNALDCMIIDDALIHALSRICEPLKSSNVVIHADEKAFEALSGSYPEQLLLKADADTYGREFLAYEMAVKTVDGVEEALNHINTFGSGHSESIVAEDKAAASLFQQAVDAACVYVNAPTSFTDGAQFGMGAEIGISTQKLHARGPMALNELMTYKWLINGNGQTRP